MKRVNRVLVFAAIMTILPDLCRAQGYAIKTVAGGGSSVGNGGPATSALVTPQGIAVDALGNLYISEPGYNLIRKVTPDGIISPFAGTLGASGYAGDGGPALGAEFQFPAQLAFDASGNLYVADELAGRVRKITASGIISTLAGGVLIPAPNLGDGGPATSAYLGLPTGVAADSAGNIYIADASAQSSIRKVSANGTITTLAGGPLNFSLTGSVGDGGPATAAVLADPHGVAVDAAGNVFIADTFNNRIRKVTPAGIISTVAGNGAASYSGDGGPATQAGLDQPQAVAGDSAGNFYIADTGDQRIRLVTPDGTITTIAGNG
jgi:sugar lactone lactonase YvrE